MRCIILLFFVCFTFALVSVVSAGTVYFYFDAETEPINDYYGDSTDRWSDSQSKVTRSQLAVKNGSWSLRHEMNPPESGLQTGKVIKMHDIDPIVAGYEKAYHSSWFYIDEGFNDTDTKNNFQWKLRNDEYTFCGVAVKIIIGFTNIKGHSGRRLSMKIADCSLPSGLYPDYDWDGSPCKFIHKDGKNPIIIENDTWFHIEVYLYASSTNGKIIVWQDGIEVFNISHPDFNTLNTYNKTPACPGEWSDNKYLYWGIGAYGGADSSKMVLYTDDAVVTDYQVSAEFCLADTNSDGVVSMTELMSYISDWKTGSVTMVDLMTAIGEWKNGC